MLSLFKISLHIFLTVTILVQHSDGNQRIVYVSELISDDFFASSEDNSLIICCVYGNCSCNSLDHALANLTSNVLINITTDVTLSTLIKIPYIDDNIENVTIIGHNNPTVNCKDLGGLHLNLCHNCIIQGIIWDGCGTKASEPALKLSNSSSIMIKNCFFQHSKGQAIILSELLGNVNITSCNFVRNNHYRGHGAAIYYSSSKVTNCHHLSVFTITECEFTYNSANSLVYIDNRMCKHNYNITIRSAKFCHNQGISVYAIYQNIYINGKILFHNNTALYGTGIFVSDHCTVVFGENSDVKFTRNSANSIGGTVLLRNHSNIIFDKNSIATFNTNKAATYGGTIYSEVSCNITFKATCEVSFTNNSAQLGGAIFSYGYNVHVIFDENSTTSFCNNSADFYGGAIYCFNDSHVIFNGNSTTLFSNNSAASSGGAIYSHVNSYTSFLGDSSPVFIDNTASLGGSIYLRFNSYVFFDGNSSPSFCNNTARYGGVIRSYDSKIFFEGNSSPVFSKNAARYGGVIVSRNSTVLFEGNSSPEFIDNIARYEGGVILSYNSNIMFEGSSSPEFSNNIADYEGGVLRCNEQSSIVFEGNSTPVFSNNTASYGGAILCCNSTMLFKGRSSPVFSENIANHEGGALKCNNESNIIFEGNSSPVFSNNTANYGGTMSYDNSNIFFKGNSSPVFSNNRADYGGAVSYDNSNTVFKGNSSAVFNDNTAAIYGGALYSTFDSKISIEGFSDVVFRNNIAEYGGAVFARDHSDIIFGDNCTVTFSTNKATFGATVFSNDSSKILVIGNSSVIFDNVSAKWCNNTCLPYTGRGDVIAIDSNGIVWCTNQKTFICLSIKCYCNKLEDLLDGLKSNKLVNITDNVTLSSVIELSDLNNISIIGYHNITAICIDGGGLHLRQCTDVIIEGITWIRCGNYDGSHVPVINLENFSPNILIQKCTFQYSLGIALLFHEIFPIQGNKLSINHCNFMNNNHYTDHGAAIHCILGSFYGTINIIINNCIFGYNGNAKSITYFDVEHLQLHNINNIYLNTSNFHNNQGASIYISRTYSLHFDGEILFENNAAENGAGIYISNHSAVTFDKSSNTTFISNSVYHNGAAIFLRHHSRVTFKESCEVTFTNNSATQYGAAICSFDDSQVTFTGNSNVTFSNNVVSSNDIQLQSSGTVYSENNGYISFENESFTVFSNNTADYGAAIFLFSNSSLTFKDSSRVMFSNNKAQYCGALTSALFSSIVHKDDSKISYNTNKISCMSTSNSEPSTVASAMCTFQRSDVIFSGHSLVTFTNNTAGGGGAIVFSESNVFIEEYCTVTFNINVAQSSSGGAFTCYNNSNVTIEGNSNVTFNSNKASEDGGAIHSYDMCKIRFKENSTSTFINNTARSNGGAILSRQLSEITVEGNSTITFDNNTADFGGAFYFINSNTTIQETSMVSFYSNKGRQEGGAGYLSSHCIFIVEENAKLTFDKNKAFHGGALYINMMTKLIFKGNSTTFFHNNLATEGGGAVQILNNSSITLNNHVIIEFTNNTAQYGGAIFLDTTAVIMHNTSDEKHIKFKSNFARILGSSVYHDVAELCNGSYLNDRITGISNKFIAAPPHELKFDDPAICVDTDNTQCNNYSVKNLMLGREIFIPVCILDHYNQPVDSLQFLVRETYPNNNYSIKGANNVLIPCDTFKGISITGNQSLSKSINFSITITLNTALYSEWKQILVNLIIELSPCYPGFWQYPNSKICECYNADDIVFCSSSSSTIKRGYWFGIVTGKPTVTVCPINYCNFTCCETSNGYYHLSPARENQCRSHRSGTACGSCTIGYTLSFDSTECVNVDSCTAGQTVLVILLTVTYWIVMVVAVFAIMYYQVEIGYLYSITYYYSIVDILLSQTLQASRALYLTVSIISSFSKITPQFLGDLCLTTGLSGIDQQFIHYIHPSAVILILVVISLLARRSRRVSAIISRGIIHVICLLLLLSYTSIASTSLLLMRSLTFYEVDKVYTYLSPDIEYFHGRHLAYGIVALLCTVTIALGLPILLILEPFLNRKINFIKIKPLLDQFQGCYKDKYRCFAGYYMICRLVIITIVVANSVNEFTANYLLTVVCGIIDLIHVTVKPYKKTTLNKLDGIILHLIIFVAALTLLDDIDSPSLMNTVYGLVILPLLIFLGMTFFLHKDDLKKIVKHFIFKMKNETPNDVNNNNEVPMREFHQIVDESERKKVTVTICDT